MTEIRSCPFCNGDAIIIQTKVEPHRDFLDGLGYMIHCLGCSVSQGCWSNKKTALTEWNTRTIDENYSKLLAFAKNIVKNEPHAELIWKNARELLKEIGEDK